MRSAVITLLSLYIFLSPASAEQPGRLLKLCLAERELLPVSSARAILDKLVDLDVPRDSDTPQEAQMMTRMLSGHSDIGIGREDAVTALLEFRP